MKKSVLTGLFALILLAGCGNQSTNSQNTTASTERNNSSALAQRLETLNKANFPQLSPEVADNEAQVKLITSQGDITIKLFPEYAPLAVKNFLTHAKEGYYKGLTFHRVINNFMIQSGDPKGDGTGGESIWNGKDASIDSGMGFANEVSDYLYNIRGALAMANAGPDTNGSQFYIVQNKDNMIGKLNPQLYPEKLFEAYQKGGYPQGDGNYTVFGQVTQGMDVVDKIAESPTDSKDKPLTDIIIEDIQILKDYPKTDK
ncbi:peptidylprolyl isomerase [Streptococcus cuniculipharyngis]|uniref:Peptidyl-prolyl cis-trans isomerase n=1 Tax=Streptococcus cuniculipharyngis TaxID=1562651 RepID=A0A5C5SDS9_9STRE|nr:peptidylprolyl isomerase [Streptococcus cuniculipharyngis]TWS99257.1 peptidylprolyl isomerase [Streptococcus cuniculipharyngis]